MATMDLRLQHNTQRIRWGMGDGLDYRPKPYHCVIAKDIQSCAYFFYVRCATLLVFLGVCLGTTHYDAHKIGRPDRGHAKKGLVACNSLDLEPSYLQNSLALCCFNPPLRYKTYGYHGIIKILYMFVSIQNCSMLNTMSKKVSHYCISKI